MISSILATTVCAVSLLLEPTTTTPVEERSSSTVDCPPGAEWHGDGPPHDVAYFCARESGGTLVKHGWSVNFDEFTGVKKEECEYSEGILHGRCSTYNAAGEPESRGFYHQGTRIGYWFFWDPIDARQSPALQRRELQDFLEGLDVATSEVPPLAQYLFEHLETRTDDIRNVPQVCGPHHCVSAGLIGRRWLVAVLIGAVQEKVEASRLEYAAVSVRSSKQQLRDDAEAAKRERAYRTARRAYEQAVRTYDKRVRAWEYTSLQCNDGKRSPSCICGGSHRGCCSHHGGVAGCPREYPEAPTEPRREEFEAAESRP